MWADAEAADARRLTVSTTERTHQAPPPVAGACDSDPLDAELRAMGVEMIAPPHPRRRRKTQDGRPLRRYPLIGTSNTD
jgi:hypothetical protein